MKQKRNRWIAAALVCGLLLAGCGAADSGQDSTGVTQSGSAAAAAGSGTGQPGNLRHGYLYDGNRLR